MSTNINKIKSYLIKNNLGAFFISDQHNVTYLTCFSGLKIGSREAYLLVTANNNYLIASATYSGLYHSNPDFIPLEINPQNRLKDHLKKIIIKEKLFQVCFEKNNLTVAEYDSLKSYLNTQLTPTENIIERYRLIKSWEEIRKIRIACQLTEHAFTLIKQEITGGISEKELALKLEMILKTLADGVAFPPIVAFNRNASIPHYLPTNDVKLQHNSFILLDFGAEYSNYCADMTRLVYFGSPDRQFIKIYETVLAAQKLTVDYLQEKFYRKKAKVTAQEVDMIARNYLSEQGYIPYPHGLGHGVGIAIHEEPRLRPNSDSLLKNNMVFSIEPALYISNWGGVRIEDLVVLGKDRLEILTGAPKNWQEHVIA